MKNSPQNLAFVSEKAISLGIFDHLLLQKLKATIKPLIRSLHELQSQNSNCFSFKSISNTALRSYMKKE